LRSDHRALLLRRQDFSAGLFSATFRAPRLASQIAAGQFVMLEIPGCARPYLRRAYSVADARREGGEVEFLVKTVGPGTAALECMPAGAEARLLGPLGNSFRLDGLTSRARVAVVAGGIGAAPFPLLYRAMKERGIAGDLFLGGRTERDLAFRERLLPHVTGETVLATDDGSLGEKGFVTGAFRRRVEPARYDRVFACGPGPMFAALGRIVADLAIPAEFSTEAEMGCGIGACLGCVLPGVEKPFIISCTEGPILAPELVKW
jgi:dihydroorotate dehydrogenase electron transfer subunit